MKSATFRHLTGAVIVILFALWIISCKQEQYETNPASNSTFQQTDAEYSQWSAPVNLGSVINTSGDENRPALSKDMLSLYFGSDRPGTVGSTDIWVSHRESVDAPWGTPQNLGTNINSTGIEAAPAFSPDGHHLYFYSDGRGGCGLADIFVSFRQDKNDDLGWEPAENMGCTVNTQYVDAGPTYFEDEEHGITTLYHVIQNHPNGIGDLDIFACTKYGENGTFGPPVLVPNLNGPFRDTRTAIRKDGLELFISSDVTGRIGGIGGQDLWVSTRTSTEDTWSVPVNLGSLINTTAFDGGPALSFDGTTLLFHSNRPGGLGGNDLYTSTRTKVHGSNP